MGKIGEGALGSVPISGMGVHFITANGEVICHAVNQMTSEDYGESIGEAISRWEVASHLSKIVIVTSSHILVYDWEAI